MPGSSSAYKTIKDRRDFLAARDGFRVHKPPFVLQARHRPASQQGSTGVRFGFTVTKKIGNAVKRNRIKRRLREAVRAQPLQVLQALGSRDVVLIARRDALNTPFDKLCGHLGASLQVVVANGRSNGQNPRNS